MKAGVVAAACAALPLKSAFGRNTPQGSGSSFIGRTGSQPSLSGQTGLGQLDYYTRSSFTPYVDTQFRVYVTPSSSRALMLKQVSDYITPQGAGTQQPECFSLFMTKPPGNAFEQNTYLIEHEALGSLYLFLVPVSGKNQSGLDYYEAVIYRHVQLPEGYEIPKTTAPERLTVKAQPVPPSMPTNGGAVNSGAVVVNQSAGTKTEQEVFYFRPEEIKDNAPVEKPDPGAEGRRIASRLTVAQAPSVSRLKLGMKVEQVLALFPGSKDDADIRASLAGPTSAFGVQNLSIMPAKYLKKNADQASQIALTFLDNRLVTLYVGYESPVWDNIDDYVTQFAGETGLPGADSWDAYAGFDTQLKTLKCKDFEINLFAGGENVSINYVRMRDMPAQQVLKERRARARKKNVAKA
jgi:hypothetical protein